MAQSRSGKSVLIGICLALMAAEGCKEQKSSGSSTCDPGRTGDCGGEAGENGGAAGENSVTLGGDGGVGGSEEDGGTASTGGGAGNAGGVVSPSAPAVSVATGFDHYCVALQDGTVRCEGSNREGQLGLGTSGAVVEGENTSPDNVQSVVGISSAVAVSAGDGWSCALLSDGTVQCWGNNGWAQLGDGTTEDSAVPVTVSDLRNAIGISASSAVVNSSRNCAVLADDSAWCWSSYQTYETVNGTTVYTDVKVPIQAWSSNVVKIAAGDKPCAVTRDGAIECASYSPANGGRFEMSRVEGLSGAVDVAVGGGHACAVLDDGTAWCWGANDHGNLGNGTEIDSEVPVQVSNVTNAVAIGAGMGFSCAVLATGKVQCWGDGSMNRLGPSRLPFPQSSTIPIDVEGPTTAVAISVAYNSTCVLTSEGEVSCWGAV